MRNHQALRFYFRIAQTLCERLVATLSSSTTATPQSPEKKLEHSPSNSNASASEEVVYIYKLIFAGR